MDRRFLDLSCGSAFLALAAWLYDCFIRRIDGLVARHCYVFFSLTGALFTSGLDSSFSVW